MNRKIFCFALGALLLALCVSARAQQPKKVPRIGMLMSSSASSQKSRLDDFRDGLRELGYVERQNILIEYRYANGKLDQLPALAAELVSLKVELIVTTGNEAVQAVKNTTQTLPIVMAFSGDPVAAGFVASLSRPGGNITGLSRINVELTAKQLELLKETIPRVVLVAVLFNPEGRVPELALKDAKAAATPLGLKLQTLQVRAANDLEIAFRSAASERANALLVLPGGFLGFRRKRIADLAAKGRLPTMFGRTEAVEDGGLMSYGATSVNEFRRAAYFVDRILKGAKPADLPVEQPTKFEFVINLKTAKQIGLTIPPNVLARADRVIR
jgi:putative ABC transport system substrate-binding protein